MRRTDLRTCGWQVRGRGANAACVSRRRPDVTAPPHFLGNTHLSNTYKHRTCHATHISIVHATSEPRSMRFKASARCNRPPTLHKRQIAGTSVALIYVVLVCGACVLYAAEWAAVAEASKYWAGNYAQLDRWRGG
eukprot:3181330-Rhodomonas_salina.1